MLNSLFPSFFNAPKDLNPQVTIDSLKQDGAWFENPTRREPILRKGASWRRMHPIQPAAKIADVIRDLDCYMCGPDLRVETGQIMDESGDIQGRGVTMGFLWDLVVNLLDKHSDVIVSIDWRLLSLDRRLLSLDWRLKDQDENEEISVDAVAGIPRTIPVQNTIVIYSDYFLDDHDYAPEPSGLAVVEWKPNVIEWHEVPESEQGTDDEQESEEGTDESEEESEDESEEESEEETDERGEGADNKERSLMLVQ